MKDINVLPKNITLKEDIVVRAIVNTPYGYNPNID